MSKEKALYSTRVLRIFIPLLREKYPEVSISDVLSYAGIEAYTIVDEGCWLTQKQVDRFNEKVAQLTGNKHIARDAGRLAASPNTIGALAQYTFGLLGPSLAFKIINRLSKGLTRSSDYQSKTLKHNQVEITVKPYVGTEEKPYQCDNRKGFFEAIVVGFRLGLPRVEHPECLFEGGDCCRYIITWKRTLANFFSLFRNIALSLFILSITPGYFIFSQQDYRTAILTTLIIGLVLSLATEVFRRREMVRSIDNLRDSSERLTQLIDSSARNVQLVNEIGQALVNKASVEDVLDTVSELMDGGLDFDCGAILLGNTEKTRLTTRAAFGYSVEKINRLMETAFNLERPDSQGPFVQAYHQKKPFLIDSTKDIQEKLSERSRSLLNALEVNSLLCCPILVENEPLGVIAVTNKQTMRPLLRSDVNLLQGIAPVIGVAVQNARLIEKLQSSFEETLGVLAASIDARDNLTAGHSEVVTEYAAGIAEAMGQSDEFISMIRVASLLHDYGKIGVPDSILKKNGRLSPEERDIINTHPDRTRQILSQVSFQGIHQQIPEVAGAHHERWDGNGYPEGLKGEEIPLGARVIAAADFFEAITSKRHYRQPMPLQDALNLLRNSSGSHFDPQVVDALVTFLENRSFQLIRPKGYGYGFASMPESRRLAPRAEYRTQVSIRQGQRVIGGDTVNISTKGVYITSSVIISDHEPITLTFAFPGAEGFMQVAGRVSWANPKEHPASFKQPYGFAVSFIELPKHAKELINQFLRQQYSSIPGGENRPIKKDLPNGNGDKKRRNPVRLSYGK